MHTKNFFFLVLLTVLFSSAIFAQEQQTDLRSWIDASSNWNIQTDSGVSCSGGVARDDGTYENGYRSVSTGDSTTMLHRMQIPAGVTAITAICVTWTALSPSGNLGPYQLVIYDNSGSGGAPGNVPVAVVTGVVSNGVAIYPGHSRYRYDVNITGLTTGAYYYIGVRWNNNPVLPFFSSMDENGTANGFGYQRNTTTFPPTWSPLTTSFPNWKNCSFRFEYSSGPPQIGIITVCRNGLNGVIPNNGTLRDSLLISLPPLSCIKQLTVRIDTLTHTWDYDLRMYINRGNIGTRFINNVGGSGDNFIGTNIKGDTTGFCQIGSSGCNTAPFTGTYAPSVGGSFASFMNTSPNGYWVLSITDTATGDTGALKSWCVTIRYDTFYPGCFIGVNTNTNQIPTQYSLEQNYPNPFNPSTKIKFSIPASLSSGEGQRVRLIVFDVLGREVATLVNESTSGGLKPGTYEVDFDGTNYSSGVYYYMLSVCASTSLSTTYTETKKMLIIK